MSIKKKFLLRICSFLFVLQIDAGWRDQWVWFKSLFSGFSIKKPIITRKQVVIGGVGALAVAGAAWWWFKRISKKSPPQKNESPKKEEPIESASSSIKNEERPSIIPTNIEISDPDTNIVIQTVNKDNDNLLLKKEEVIPENIKNDINIAQELHNISSTINTRSVQEEQQKAKEAEEKAKIAQKYQQMNQTVYTKNAIQDFKILIDDYEKKEILTDVEISTLKTEFERLNSTIPKDQKLLWNKITMRYNQLISTKK